MRVEHKLCSQQADQDELAPSALPPERKKDSGLRASGCEKVAVFSQCARPDEYGACYDHSGSCAKDSRDARVGLFETCLEIDGGWLA